MINGTLSGVNTSSYAVSKTNKNPMEADFETLSKAIESGDLDAAKKAYASIKERMQQHQGADKTSGTTSTKKSDAASSFETDFDALGEALESGDLSAAKKAVSTINENMKTHKPPQKPPSEQNSYDTMDKTTDWRSLLIDGSTLNISA